MTAKRQHFGSVRQVQPSRRWQARHRLDGRLISIGTFAKEAEAYKALARVNADLQRGVYLDPKAGVVGLSTWSNRWLAQHETQLKPSTAASYRSILDTVILQRTIDGRAAGLGTLALRRITVMTVKEWLAAIQRGSALGRSSEDGSMGPLGPSRSRKALGLLSMILDAAVDDGLIATNPCRKVKRPRLPEPAPKVIAPADVARLVIDVPAPYGLLFEVLAWGGLRTGEAIALRRRDFDSLGGRILVDSAITEVNGKRVEGTTKSHQARAVLIPAFLVSLLEAHLESLPTDLDTWIFPNKAGNPITNKTLRRHFDAARERASLPDITPHSLRASCASWVAESDGVLEAARRLGHSNASITTRHYARPMSGGDVTVASNLEALHNKAIKAEEGSPAALALRAAVA